LTTDQMIELHLHIATNYTISTSYNEALRQANAALALDPNNANALAQRARIEQAATEGL
jgi:Tfp pilus assembly protein PilF